MTEQSTFELDRAAIEQALESAASWDEATRSLARLGYHLQPRIMLRAGVYLTDRNDNQFPITNFCTDGVPGLSARYRETWSDYSRRILGALAHVSGTPVEELLRNKRY